MDFTYLRPGKVWEALEGHADRPSLRTVERWCETGTAPQWAGEVIRNKIGQTKEAPPPTWATGLVEDVPAIRNDVEKVATELAILRALLEARQSGLLQPDDDPVDDPPLVQRADRRGR